MSKIGHAVWDFMRASAVKGLHKIPESIAKVGLVLSTRSLALGTITGVTAFCGAEQWCHVAANQGGDLLIDLAATGIALGALALSHKLWHHMLPVTAALIMLFMSPDGGAHAPHLATAVQHYQIG